MIASLPMYYRPANSGAHGRLWAGIRDGLRMRGIAAPDHLDCDVGYVDVWSRDDLVVGHICNLPYRTSFRDRVTLIGASDYGLDGCDPGFYRSVMVARIDDPRDTLAKLVSGRFAANALQSYSGYEAALRMAHHHAVTLPAPTITGAHDASVTAVAKGDADFACIDLQTWTMQQHDHPDVAALRVVGHSPSAPGMSFITAKGGDPAPYFDAIATAIADLSAPDQVALGLRAIIALPQSAYDLRTLAAA